MGGGGEGGEGGEGEQDWGKGEEEERGRDERGEKCLYVAVISCTRAAPFPSLSFPSLPFSPLPFTYQLLPSPPSAPPPPCLLL